jgi:hypothetical protein
VTFTQYGETVKIPRDEHVDVHVRRVTLNANAPSERQVEMVEIREFIKSGEIYGHGVVIPVREIADLKIALDQVAPKVAVTSG